MAIYTPPPILTTIMGINAVPTKTQLYYLESRYYNPEWGRFLNADAFVSTGGLLGNNMFAYCNNNPVVLVDVSGCRPTNHFLRECFDGGTSSGSANTEFLMAFYGVDSPREIPQMPEGAMVFVENITSVSFNMGLCFFEGRTIVMDANKYCEYFFSGIGFSYSMSIPLDVTVSQGYVYGVKHVEDYCGNFVGGSVNMLSNISGGAYASQDVYAQITGGMSYSSSLGFSVTYYITAQTGWIYGTAPMTVISNPYQFSPFSTSPCL